MKKKHDTALFIKSFFLKKNENILTSDTISYQIAINQHDNNITNRHKTDTKLTLNRHYTDTPVGLWLAMAG